MAAGLQADHAGWRASGPSVVNVQRIGLDVVRVALEAGSSEDAWREIRSVTPLSLDVLVQLLAHRSAPPGQPRLLRASDVLEAKGCRRFGDERRALERQIAAELQRSRRIVLGRLSEFAFELIPLEDGVSFLYQPRPWLDAVWATSPIRTMDRRVLQFDHRANRGADVLAKKLAIHFSFIASAGVARRSVRSVLRAVGEGVDELGSRAGRGGRLADRFAEALLRLSENDLFEVRYGGWGDTVLEEGRMKGWIKRWMSMELVISPSSISRPASVAYA